MKKSKIKSQEIFKSITLMIGLILLSLNAFAQKNSVKFSLVTEGRFNFEYENQLTDKTSLAVGIQIYDYNSKKWIQFFEKDVYYNKGARLIANYKFFPFATGLKSFYIGPSASIGKHTVRFEDWQRGQYFEPDDDSFFSFGRYGPSSTIVTESKVVAGSVGFNIGFQKSWDWLLIDIGVSNSRNFILNTKRKIGGGVSESEYKNEIKGVQPAGYIGVGVRF